MVSKKDDFSRKTILITGGTGSFGQAYTEFLLKYYPTCTIRIFSRDELKQSEMAIKFKKSTNLRFFIGDVRDKERLRRAFEGVNIVVHAAALKQVPACEYNPIEAINTNILGSQNVIEAALDKKVHKVILISSDKAVQPLNLYGATKLCAEKLFVQSNSYRGNKNTFFSVVRYGNVIGSRGSVLPIFLKQMKAGVFTITDQNMTRFWITLLQACQFVTNCLSIMKGGEIFVPKIKSLKIVDLARALNSKAKLKFIGVRPGEKVNEILITVEEYKRTHEYKTYFEIEPEFSFWRSKNNLPRVRDTYYGSDNNKEWLTKEAILGMIYDK